MQLHCGFNNVKHTEHPYLREPGSIKTQLMTKIIKEKKRSLTLNDFPQKNAALQRGDWKLLCSPQEAAMSAIFTQERWHRQPEQDGIMERQKLWRKTSDDREEVSATSGGREWPGEAKEKDCKALRSLKHQDWHTTALSEASNIPEQIAGPA